MAGDRAIPRSEYVLRRPPHLVQRALGPQGGVRVRSRRALVAGADQRRESPLENPSTPEARMTAPCSESRPVTTDALVNVPFGCRHTTTARIEYRAMSPIAPIGSWDTSRRMFVLSPNGK